MEETTVKISYGEKSDCIDQSLEKGKLKYFSIPRQDSSTQRKNQDGLIVFKHLNNTILALSDGMGGLSSGAKASHIALSQLEYNVAQVKTEKEIQLAILESFDLANEKIHSINAGATLLVCQLTPGHIRFYHCGDSAGMQFSKQAKLIYRTLDHSPIGMALEAGMISEKEALEHDEAHYISNGLGLDPFRIEVSKRLSYQKATLYPYVATELAATSP